jgi:hypothetical protein
MNRYSTFIVEQAKYGFEQKGIFDHQENIEFLEVVCNESFISIGISPTPKNKKEWFRHNMLHGLLMKYSFWAVLEYSIRDYFDYWKNWKGKQ